MTEAPRAAAQYASLLSPIRIGKVEIPNRIVRTAHGTNLAEDGLIGPDLIEYHKARAKGGVGLTILEISAVHPTTGGLRGWDDSIIAGYQELMSALRGYPMKVFQQLFHGGRGTFPRDGGPSWSVSGAPSIQTGEAPLAIDKTQIEELIAGYAGAARRAVEGGIDGIEVHAGHGYLLGSFLSPYTNDREDEYGGNFENRLRLVIEVLQAVRQAVGGAVPVGIRVSADECIAGGLTVPNSIEIAQALEGRSLIDFLDVSLGSPMNYPKVIGGMDEPLGYELPMSVPVAQSVKVPSIVAGKIKTLAHAEEIVRNGQAELVSIVRAHIADPDLIAKSIRGDAHRVRPCISCNQMCVGGISVPGGRLGCTVNPDAGFEAVAAATAPSSSAWTVLVAGGGPAGMEAARTAAESGCRVILCEADYELGGQLRWARKSPTRGEIGEIADWLASELRLLHVDIRLGTYVTPELVRDLTPNRLIVATGSRPRCDGFQTARPQLNLLGVDLPHVVTSWQVLDDSQLPPATRAVVYDEVGHYEAVAVAETLLNRGWAVTFVTRLASLAPLLVSARMDGTIKERLMQRAFKLLPDSFLLSISEDSIKIGSLHGGRTRKIAAGLVVRVTGNQPVRELADSAEIRLPTHLVGDALRPRFLGAAMADGRRAGLAAARGEPTAFNARSASL